MLVLQRCRALVAEEQKQTQPTPAFILMPDDAAAFDVQRMSNATGMQLVTAA